MLQIFLTLSFHMYSEIHCNQAKSTNFVYIKNVLISEQFNELENNNTEANNNWSAIIITLHQQGFSDDLCLPMARFVN